jgi:hypothetical protein
MTPLSFEEAVATHGHFASFNSEWISIPLGSLARGRLPRPLENLNSHHPNPNPMAAADTGAGGGSHVLAIEGSGRGCRGSSGPLHARRRLHNCAGGNEAAWRRR